MTCWHYYSEWGDEWLPIPPWTVRSEFDRARRAAWLNHRGYRVMLRAVEKQGASNV